MKRRYGGGDQIHMYRSVLYGIIHHLPRFCSSPLWYLWSVHAKPQASAAGLTQPLRTWATPQQSRKSKSSKNEVMQDSYESTYMGPNFSILGKKGKRIPLGSFWTQQQRQTRAAKERGIINNGCTCHQLTPDSAKREVPRHLYSEGRHPAMLWGNFQKLRVGLVQVAITLFRNNLLIIASICLSLNNYMWLPLPAPVPSSGPLCRPQPVLVFPFPGNSKQ